jgi:hypothetical protein
MLFLSSFPTHDQLTPTHLDGDILDTVHVRREATVATKTSTVNSSTKDPILQKKSGLRLHVRLATISASDAMPPHAGCHARTVATAIDRTFDRGNLASDVF